ncbi:hypothetical protein [Amycolatopsis sp. CA-230715]|uniref:hypothetical protein n=1 Tax=Amycolatopsis sp. CA-230715 TaxID=2745196 RepID=UPI001C031A3C|nr:hypothetical protein [Amycolatopsis sp. CA-230715]QWF77581.1 hypothetical protein HUW46_00973 [Amycolatopsis sp. CA-230715]
MGSPHDFDFLHGRWAVANRKLSKPLTGSDDWEEFDGVAECRPHFGGAANIDEISFPGKGFSGLTLRLFAPETGQWSLYWANSRDGALLPPVTGDFADGEGWFYGDDEHEGTPVRVSFRWSDITGTTARWEQAFSIDGGTTWEPNWVMELTRA